MIPQSCKRLAEVDFPIAEVSKHAAREKSIRHGHPSTLHLWWARRPLASSRAILLGLLLPDPCDELCPGDFKSQARVALRFLPGLGNIAEDDEALRHALLKFIGDFANWDYASDKTYLDAGRALVHAAHPEETPLVVDPFAGGGSIPLEALRLGCDAFASDLNPVACLILKVMLEDIPRHGPELADELRRVGAEVKANAEKELAEFYPADADGAKPIAYLWARTVRCESPNCGAEIPLMRSFWLSKKASRKKALRVKEKSKRAKPPTVEFEIFEPRKDSDVPNGTVARAKATCLCCSTVLPPDRVRAQLRKQRGGADVIFDGKSKRVGGARLLAVVTLRDDAKGRQYRLPTERDYDAVWQATKRLQKISATLLPNGLAVVPDEPTPWKHGHRSIGAPRIYGMEEWGQLFTRRQLLTLQFFASRIRKTAQDGEKVSRLLGLLLSKLVELTNSDAWWEPIAECPRTIYGRHDLPATWDFAEANPVSQSSGSFTQVLENSLSNLRSISTDWKIGQVEQADACKHPLPDGSVGVWFTDPPYYDAVAYSDLSDLFYVWLKRAVPDIAKFVLIDPGSTLTPKLAELTVTTAAGEDLPPKTQEMFERGMACAFSESRRTLSESGIGCVVFAHKSTEGWESLLTGILSAGWIIKASWPIRTEQSYRLSARDNASLATSVHLICRPRTSNDIGDWSDVVRELPRRVADWIDRLQKEGVRGADLVFACIGPALEIYSRYAKVVDAQDREIPLGGNPEATEPYQRGYLAYVWEVVGRTALEQVLGTAEANARNGGAGALEEDARLTALFLWTMQSTNEPTTNEPIAKEDEDEGDDEDETPKKTTKGFSLVYDVVRRFAQPLGIHLQDWEARIIETDKGIVRLLAVSERAQQLFGDEGATAVASELEENPARAAQLSLALFPEERNAAPELKIGKRRRSISANVSDDSLHPHREATTLDRVHAAMLLQQSGRTNALRALLQAEQERGPNFLRLANSLSALYPRDSEEKRLLDAMLLAVPR